MGTNVPKAAHVSIGTFGPSARPVTTPAKTLGDLIAQAREAKGLTQEEVAADLATNRSVVGRWERNESTPRRRTREALAALFDVPQATFEAAVRAENEPDEPNAPVRNGASDTVPVSRETLGYLRGKLETTVEWLGSVENQMGALGSSVRAVGETLQALRQQLDRATNGVSVLLTGDVLPLPPRPTREETLATVAAAGVRPPPAPPIAASDR